MAAWLHDGRTSGTQGVVKVGDEVEIVGLQLAPTKTIVTGVEMFKKVGPAVGTFAREMINVGNLQTLDRGEAGDNVGLLMRSIKRTDVQRGQLVCQIAERLGAVLVLVKLG